ncbi:hypothetical protein O5584_08355 [Escherichia coli]|nr:hypothetical protein [Escherichia coli]MCZ5481593.1 hypothetical protein [Escherichia coli]
MTKMTGLDAFYNESEDKIWFGNLISELARLNNENERMIAAAILSNYRLSKTKPDTLGGWAFISSIGYLVLRQMKTLKSSVWSF